MGFHRHSGEMAASPVSTRYGLRDHWRCLLSCSIVASTAFLYGWETINFDTLQAMPGFLEVRFNYQVLALVGNNVVKPLGTGLWKSRPYNAHGVQYFASPSTALWHAPGVGKHPLQCNLGCSIALYWSKSIDLGWLYLSQPGDCSHDGGKHYRRRICCEIPRWHGPRFPLYVLQSLSAGSLAHPV